MKTRVIALLCLLVVYILSCNAPKNTYSSDSRESTVRETSKILFLNYQLTRDSATMTYDAQLLSMLTRDGKIKDNNTDINQIKMGDLELLVVDMNEHTIIHRHIPNPLDRSVEYVNDAGQFERKMIHLDSAQFSVRLQMESGVNSILLNGFIANDTDAKLLLKTPIL